MITVKDIWHQIKCIPFIGIPYEKYIGSKPHKRRIAKMCANVNDYGIDAVDKIEQTLAQISELFYVDCGTLLGTIREHNFISWDGDIDYGIVITDNFSWDAMEKAMNEAGLKKTRVFHLEGVITEQTYANDRISIDFFAHFINPDGTMRTYSYYKIPGVRYKIVEYSAYEFTTVSVTNLRKEKLRNIYVNVPENAEEYLADIYTENWKTPDQNYDSFASEKCRLLEDKKGIITEYR